MSGLADVELASNTFRSVLTVSLCIATNTRLLLDVTAYGVICQYLALKCFEI